MVPAGARTGESGQSTSDQPHPGPTPGASAIIDQEPNMQNNDRWATALAAIPDELVLIGGILELADREQTVVGVPVGAPLDLLDLYTWDGREWSFAPSVTTRGGLLPAALDDRSDLALATMQVTGNRKPIFGLWGPSSSATVTGLLPYVTEMTVGSLIIHPDGAISGETSPSVPGDLVDLLHATCAGEDPGPGTVRSTGPPVDTASQQLAINGLIDQVARAGYDGLNLDCQLLTSRAADFVHGLADALHDHNLLLGLTIRAADDRLAGGESNNAWASFSSLADLVYLRLPEDPRSHMAGNQAESLLSQVVRLVDRRKLNLMIDTRAFEAAGNTGRRLDDFEALTMLADRSEIRLTQGVRSGNHVTARLSGSIQSLIWDPGAAAYAFSFEETGQLCNVWLTIGGGLELRMALGDRYLVRGQQFTVSPGLESILRQALATDDTHPSMAALGAAPPVEWTVKDAAGNIVANNPNGTMIFAWQAGPSPGDYVVQADLLLGSQSINLGVEQITVVDSPTPETPKPETPAPVSTLKLAVGEAAVRESTTLREGPGLAFTQLGQLQAGQVVSLTGRTANGNWLRVTGGEAGHGWLLSVQLDVQVDTDTHQLAMIEYDPPDMAPAALDVFSLGGQTHRLARPNLMAESGMTWVKIQHKWASGQQPEIVADLIREAHANGLHVLLSITGKQMYPESIDYDGFIAFLSGVAGLGPDAIEVWNESNLHREWPAGQIDPVTYVDRLLAPAYQAIKARNQAVLVISGALAPTGVDDGVHVWADDRYLAGMAAAGAVHYLDCIGVHHNAGATSPYSLSGHPGGDHYSWYFWPTLRLYYEAFGGRRPVCFTELGYLTSAGYGELPSGFSWAAGTTLAQHARWLAEAAYRSKISDQVRLMIVFNVDLSHWDDDPQAGYAMLRPDGGCPACATLADVMSPG
jgi:hypothetical protein